MRTLVTSALAALAMMSLGGCAALLLIPPTGSFSSATGSSGSGGSGSSGGFGEPSPVQAYSDGSTSERGNITKQIGERAGETSSDRTKRIDTFVVTRIVMDPTCVNSALAPANGHYLEVDMTVTSTDALGSEGNNATLDLSPANWNYYPGGGGGGAVASSASDDCRVAVPPLNPLIGPNVNTSGSIVLDVNGDSSWIALVPYSNAPGWEWPYTPPTS